MFSVTQEVLCDTDDVIVQGCILRNTAKVFRTLSWDISASSASVLTIQFLYLL